MTEAQFQQAVIDLARWTGWRIFHPRTVKTADGRHLTAYLGDKGFPDLVLVHEYRGVIFAELKSNMGRLDVHQEDWGRDLTNAGAEYHVWRPKDWDTIKNRLKGNCDRKRND